MNKNNILKELEYNRGYFPDAAVKAAIKMQEDITDDLLNIIINTSEHIFEKAAEEDYFAHIYALFLMAQFREKRAFPVIMDFITKSQEDIDYLLGDVITEGLGNIIASVFNGDIRLIYQVIEDEELDEFIRSAALKSLVVLVAHGSLDRSEVINYFKILFQKGHKNQFSLLDHLTYESCSIFPGEVITEIEETFE